MAVPQHLPHPQNQTTLWSFANKKGRRSDTAASPYLCGLFNLRKSVRGLFVVFHRSANDLALHNDPWFATHGVYFPVRLLRFRHRSVWVVRRFFAPHCNNLCCLEWPVYCQATRCLSDLFSVY